MDSSRGSAGYPWGIRVLIAPLVQKRVTKKVTLSLDLKDASDFVGEGAGRMSPG